MFGLFCWYGYPQFITSFEFLCYHVLNMVVRFSIFLLYPQPWTSPVHLCFKKILSSRSCASLMVCQYCFLLSACQPGTERNSLFSFWCGTGRSSLFSRFSLSLKQILCLWVMEVGHSQLLFPSASGRRLLNGLGPGLIPAPSQKQRNCQQVFLYYLGGTVCCLSLKAQGSQSLGRKELDMVSCFSYCNGFCSLLGQYCKSMEQSL